MGTPSGEENTRQASAGSRWPKLEKCGWEYGGWGRMGKPPAQLASAKLLGIPALHKPGTMVLERKTRIKHSGDEDTGLPWLREADSLGEKEERLMHCSPLLPPTPGPVPKGHHGR